MPTETTKKIIRYTTITVFGILSILFPVPYLYALDNFDKFHVGIKILGFIGYTILLWECVKYFLKTDFGKKYLGDKEKG